LNYGLTWSINPNSPYQNWFSSAISSTGQYITAVSPGDNIYTSITPYYSQAISGLLTTNNLTVTGTTTLVGPTNPITMLDGSVLTTAEFPLDYVDGFAINWTTSNTASMTSVNSVNIAISSTGQYQTIVSSTVIYNSKNYGINWATISATPTSNCYFLNITSSGSGQLQYTCTSSYPTVTGGTSAPGYIYKSTNFGMNWTVFSALPKIWTSIACSNDGKNIVACANGSIGENIYFSSDFGNTYASLNGSISTYWISICLSSSGQYIYAASTINGANTGYIYSSNNYGTSFKKSTSTSQYWQSISCSFSGQYVVAVASNHNAVTADYIYISSNYGVNFSSTGISLYWQYISVSGSGEYMIAATQGSTAGSAGAIYKSIDFGKTWTLSGALINQAYNGVCISSTGQYLAACSTTGIFISTTPYPMFSISNTLNVGGQVTASSFNATSDYRIKDNVEPLAITNTSIDTLKPIKFFNTKSQKSDIGFLAHEVQESFPFLVNGEKDGGELQTLNYIGIIGILVNEVQELKREVKRLKEQNII
jgi:photosystem II stability/assembly factor-like uncharacterized protein